MSVVCDACGRSNRAAAMFCMGCAARLPGFAASGLSALKTMPAALSEVPAPASPAPKPVSPTLAHATDPLVLWLQLGAPVLAMTVAFAAWYLYIQRTDAEAPLPSRASALALDRTSPVPTAPLMATPVTEALAGLPSSAPLEAPAEVVARFYRALSAGDGRTAAAFVTPAKQGVPAFSEAALSKFYGSFRDPLLLRSIRQIDANVVEAKYRYRVTKTACEGTAIVETEPGLQGRVIRSIRANC